MTDLKNVTILYGTGGQILYENKDAKSFKELLELAVKEKVNIKGADISDRDLSGIDLSGVDLSGCTAINVNFSNANLSGTNFSNSIMKWAKFRNACLTLTCFHHTDLEHTLFTNAFGGNIDFSWSKCDFSSMLFVDFENANFDNASFDNASFEILKKADTENGNPSYS